MFEENALRSKIVGTGMASLLALLLAGCGGGRIETRMVPDGSALIMTADLRAVLLAENVPSARGPMTIRCAEPQPDAIRAIAREFAGAIEASGGPLGAADASVAAAASSATREAVAELGKRTPTIQLMRDLLYRLCEARMNDVIRPGESIEIFVPESTVTIPYSFDQLAVDVIKQIDNMTIAMHAVDGLTNTGIVGQAVINATAAGMERSEASASVGEAATTASGTATTLNADIDFAPGTFSLDKDSAAAISTALVKIVAIALNEDLTDSTSLYLAREARP